MYNTVSGYLSTGAGYGYSAWEGVKAITPGPIATIVNGILSKPAFMIYGGAITLFMGYCITRKRINDTKYEWRDLNEIKSFLHRSLTETVVLGSVATAFFAIAHFKK